jgi:hypothetical protein
MIAPSIVYEGMAETIEARIYIEFDQLLGILRTQR